MPPPGALEFARLGLEAVLLSGYLAALAALTGWSYADRYFAALGLNLSAIDGMNETSMLGYALWVLQDAMLSLGFVVAAAALLSGMAAVRRRRVRLATTTLAGAAAAGCMALLLLGGYAGGWLADRQVARYFAVEAPPYPRLQVTAKAGTVLKKVLEERGDLGRSTCLRKVFMDQSRLYAYAGYESLRAAVPNMLIIPLEDVALVEVLPGNAALCRP